MLLVGDILSNNVFLYLVFRKWKFLLWRIRKPSNKLQELLISDKHIIGVDDFNSDPLASEEVESRLTLCSSVVNINGRAS